MLPRHFGDGGHFADFIDRAPLGGLGQGHGARLDVVNAELFRIGHGFGQLRRLDLAVARRETDKLRAPGKKSRRAGLVGDDMRRFGTVNRAEGRHDLRKRERIGRGPLVTGKTATCVSNTSLTTDCSLAVSSSPP